MASQCKRQQCTIDRRGFRQELDSWRHKLIHCVGFESILEGLFGSELVEDLKLFKDLEPVTVSDWSFDENCLFCCLRRDKVKEHLIGNEGLQDTLKPLLVKDQIAISRLEKQAEEFLNAVLCRKDVPSFLDPHIPVVARDILQRMIRQFAAEYTSKTSSPQDSSSDPQPVSDQSQPSPPLLSGAPPSSPAASQAGSAHNQNPVLSKLLMADQDAPLDLTIKKPQSEPSEQEGVLDLSIKKNRHSSCVPARSSCLSPVTSSLKGECPDVRLVKAKELQSTSTLEQFMAKLCRHHQRQIIDAIGFLQTEVKALASSKTQPTFAPASRIQGPACSTPKSSTNSPEKSCSELRILSETNLKPEVQDMSHSFLGSCVMKKSPETIVALKTSVTAGPVLDLRSPGSGGNQALIPSSVTPVDTDNNRHSDHVPLKMKIMKTSNIAAGKKLSCVLTSSLSSDSGTLEERQGNSNSSSRTETHGARLSSSVKRHNQLSHAHQARQRDTLGHAKDVSAKPYSAHTAIPVESPRTARKTIRGSAEHQNRDSACRGIVDPELGHCDIVYIDKPITECLKEQHRNMLPRRNARKSTRGHMYSDEIWEIKTVRTLAGRGNCPNPMPELTTPVTPKQVLSKPEGVPPVDMPFAGTCREPMSEQMSTEDSDERVIPGTGDMVEEAASEADVIVENSQTDQCLTKTQASPPPLTAPESPETDLTTDIQQDTTEDSGKTEGHESIVPPTFEVEETCEPEPHENTDSLQVVSEKKIEAEENQIVEEAEPLLSSDNMQHTQPVLEQTSDASPLNQVEEEVGENERETAQAEEAQEPQADAQTISDNIEETKDPAPEMSDEQEAVTDEAETVTLHEPVETVEGEDDDEYDVSSKTLDSLLKELPPWRRKKGMRIHLPKRLRQTETVIVGYVNGRPISASDRSLRRRMGSTSPGRTPVKSSPVKAPVESEVERVNLENHAAEKPTNLISSPPPQVKDQPSETPVSASTKPLSGAAKSPKCKKAKTDQQRPPPVPEQTLDSPKRQLRSTSHKPGGTPASPSISATSVPSPKQIATQDSTPSPPPPPLPPPPPPPSGPPSPPAAPEQVECSSVQDVPMETNSEDSQQVTSSAGETSEIASESSEKPIPTNAGVDEIENDQQEHGSEESAAGESQTAVKAEAQIAPPRAKRALRNTAEATDSALMQKPNVASLKDGLAQAVDSEPSAPEKPTRMPLRSESSKVEAAPESVPQSPVDTKKLSLRSQKSPVSSGASRSVSGRQCDAASPLRHPERPSKAQARPPQLPVERVLPHSSSAPSRSEPPNKINKFYEALTGEENQQMLTNLNIKYDKMQKGWVQMDKEGQPATKYRNKADRQAAIWKSKRRARKPKSSDHQKYSPVQMLFMKGFDLKSICRWFLESTETKSLVIVKKVNTRLPSETQLCFHSSSGGSGTSQGVFPSIQAERLKKHLKKFAIASPVKSNPKSQKLIAKALEQEANVLRGKERREPPCTMQSSTSEAPRKRAESQKTAGKSKNPASARILRKYSNIRGKMQVQQTNVRLKDGPKRLQANSLKRLADAKAASKSGLKPPLKAQRSAVPVSRQLKESAAKMEKQKIFASKKAQRPPVKERAVRAQNSTRPSRDATRKDLPKRCSTRLGSPKVSEQNPGEAAKSGKTDKKPPTAAVKDEGEKPAVSKTNVAKAHAKEERVEGPVESPQQGKEAKTQEAKTQEAKTQEAKTQETKTQEAKTQEAKTQEAKTQEAKTQEAKTQEAKTQEAKTQEAKTQEAKTQEAKTQEAKTQEAKTQEAKTQEAKTQEAKTPAPAPVPVPAPAASDQVLTRSQRKMEASAAQTAKKAGKATAKTVRKASEPPPAPKAPPRPPAKRSQAATLPRSATKSAVTRAQELLAVPAKRTRTSK